MASPSRSPEDERMNPAIWFLAATALHGAEDLEVRPPSEELRARFDLAPFYEKHLNAWGVPIVSSQHVSDHADRKSAGGRRGYNSVDPESS